MSKIFTPGKLGRFAGVITEEIVIEGNWNPQQEICVDGLLLKNIVDVRPFTIYLSGKPGGGPFLTFHYLLDYLTDMYHKRVELFISYLQLWHRQAPWVQIDTNNSHPIYRYELPCLILVLFKLAVFSWENKSSKLKLKYIFLMQTYANYDNKINFTPY